MSDAVDLDAKLVAAIAGELDAGAVALQIETCKRRLSSKMVDEPLH